MKTPDFWHAPNCISMLLAPLTLPYRLGAWVDRRFTRPQHAPVPVISVGNATVGGTGKTPTTLALIPLLRALGHTPHILTRGYKGAALNAHRVCETDDWHSVGDEALLLAAAAPTWVGRNRLAAARAAADAGASIVVCDDAHQHHALHKDLSLLVVDGPYGIGNGQVLPAGPLRESFAVALARADAVVMIGVDAQNLAQSIALPVLHAQLNPTHDSAALAQGNWLAFAGIGRPEKFYASLRACGANIVATRSFADHHAYREAEIHTLLAEAQALHATPITTAKDAVKMPPALTKHIQRFDVALQFDAPEQLTKILTQQLSPPSIP